MTLINNDNPVPDNDQASPLDPAIAASPAAADIPPVFGGEASPLAKSPLATTKTDSETSLDPRTVRFRAKQSERQEQQDWISQQATDYHRKAMRLHLLTQSEEPEAYAQSIRIGKQLGKHPALVEMSLEQYRQSAQTQAFAKALSKAPKTQRFMAEYESARLAQDDVEKLARIEKQWESMKVLRWSLNTYDYVTGRPNGKNNSLWGDIVAGVQDWKLGNIGMSRLTTENNFENTTHSIVSMGQASSDEWMYPHRDIESKLADYAAQDAKDTAKYYSPPQTGNFASGVSSGVRSAVNQFFSLPLAFSPGGPGAALGVISLGQAGQSYQEGREKGLDPKTAMRFATLMGGIEGVTETLPFTRLVSDVSKGTPLWSTTKRFLLGDLLGEEIATPAQDAVEIPYIHPEKTWKEYWKERPDAAIQTAVATSVGSGATVATMKAIDSVVTPYEQKLRRAEMTQRQAADFKRFVELTQESALLKRSPETFQQFMDIVSEGSAVDQVYIDANTLMQSGVGEQIAAVSPSVAEQLPQALQTGGQIAIPVGEYAAKIAPLEQEQTLRDHLKIDPDGFSTAEANTYRQEHGDALKAEVEKVIAQQDNADAFRQSADAVRDTVKGQLDTANRFTSPVNDAYAGLVGNFYAVQADKLGMTPEDLYAQYPLKVTAESVGGYNQALENYLPAGMVKGGGDDIAALYRGEKREDGARSIFLGPTSGKLTADIPALADFSHSVDDFSLLHTKKNHGDTKIEASRGQVAITDKDVAAIPDIISNYDAIRRDLVNKRGDPIVAYAKVVDDGVLIYLEEVRRGRKDMAGLSLWKMRPTATDAQSVLQHAVSGPNVRNDGRHKGMVVKNTDDFYKKLQEKGKTYKQDNSYTAATIDIDGKTRPITNANGQPLAQTEDGLRNFWKWFGNSKAVDKNGNPLVLYHGTTADVEAFDPAKANDKMYVGGTNNTVFLSDNPDVASSYAGRRTNMTGLEESYAAGSNVVPVYLKIDKPLKANAKGDGWQYIQYKGDFYSTADLASLAQESGKDGVIVSRVVDYRDEGATGESEANTTKPSTTFAVFDPTQIKSAVGNRGTFDPADPRILYQSSTEEGPFGPILRDFKGDAPGAIAKLTEMQTGEAIGALHHPDIGDIDLVWGEEGTGHSDGYGLAKIVKHHPEVLDDLQGILSSMTVEHRSDNRIQLESDIHKGAVRLSWDGKAKQWLLTEYKKDEEGGIVTTTFTDEIASKDNSLTTASDTIVQQRIDEFHQKKSGTQRGGFTPDTLTISLLKDADLSTFLHESGHFFLEAQFDMAAQIAARQEGLTEGEKSLVADSKKVLDWFGIKDMAAWNALTFEEKRKHHEQFARGFESYLFEGKSPNTEMNGLFQRFRTWLLNIYKSARNLNVPMTDDIRGVFDRMLATEDQIALAERGRAMMPLFEAAEQAGMTEDEFNAYHTLGMNATNEAVQDLQQRGLRDMQWVRNTRGRVIKSLQKKHADMREGMRQRVADEVNNQPIYRAERFIRYGDPTAVNATAEEGTKKLEGTKLSLPALKEMYSDGPDALWRWLPTGKYGLVANEGMDPDLVADLFGYTSGDELVQKLLEAVPRKDFIEAMTDARMFEEHGELSTPDAIERMADSAVHNEVRSRFITTEYNAMAQAVGGQRILTKAAKEYAAAMIARQKVKDVRPRQYANAEARASKAADKAFKAGDIATAAAEKRNQLIQNLATKAAYETQDEIEKGLTYLHKMVKPRKTIDPDYTDQIHKLLERFDLKPKSKNPHTSLTNWLEAQQEDGYAPDVPESLKNESVTMPYWTMSVEEFRGLVDTVKQIEHIGRQKKRLLTAIKDRDYETVRDEIVASIRDNSQGREQRLREPANNLERASDMAKRFGAEHIRIATAARIMDGGKDGGSLWEYFIRTANKAGDTETRMRAEATEALMTIMKPLYDGGRMEGRATYFKSIGRSLNRGQIITMALNRGNEGNLQRLLDGENWTIEQITPILETLTAEELLAVQGIWNHFESYRPLIAAKERRVYGKEPDWVEPVPFTIKSADGQTVSLKGGYFPIKYDLKASERSGQQADAEEAKRQLQGAYTSATTRRSFTKARSEEVKGRPLSLDISGMFSSVNEIIHDLSWHEWLIDNNRLLRSHSISTAIREHYGNHTMEQFKSWSKAIAEGDRGAVEGFEWAMSLLTRGTSISGLGYNLSVAAFQPLGLSVSIPRIGARYVGLGLKKFIASPIGLGQEIMGKSDFMRYRTQTRFRELNEIQNKVRGKNKISEAIESNAYYLMVHAQLAADLPTWQGGYEKAVAEGNDESRAIALADQAVIDSQGSGMIKDMSAIERSKLLKIFTVFYSFMGSMLNTGVTMVSTATTPLGKLVASGGFMTLVAFNAIGPELLKSLLTPGDSGDWDDPEKAAKKLAGTTLDGTLGMVVFARELSPTAKVLFGIENYGYKGPTGLKALNDLYSFGQQAGQGKADDSLRKASINVAGDLLRLPSAQTNRTITGVKALVEGKTHNPMAVGFGFQEKKH